MITDYDSWHPDHGEVDVTEIIKTLMGNSAQAKGMVARLPQLLGATRNLCPLAATAHWNMLYSPFPRPVILFCSASSMPLPDGSCAKALHCQTRQIGARLCQQSCYDGRARRGLFYENRKRLYPHHP